MSRSGLVVVGMVLLGTARCPLGCRQGKSHSLPYKPPALIPIQQINPCQFRVVGEVPQKDDGWSYVGCHIDDETAIEHVHWDLDGGILTILDRNYCSSDAGAHPVELFFRESIPPHDGE